METLDRWKRDLTPYFFYVLFVTTLGPFLFGFHLSELNAPQDVITCKRQSSNSFSSDVDDNTSKSISIGTRNNDQFSVSAPKLPLPQCIPMTSFQIGLATSIFSLGGLIGAFLSGPLSSRRGRLSTIRIATLPYIAGALLSALAPSIPVLALGRCISGLGSGIAVVVVPIYIAETAPNGEKGLFGSFTQIMINFGIFTAQLLGYYLSRGQLWRVILAAGGAFGLAMLVGLTGVVESPKWLADTGQAKAAKRTLKRLRGHQFDVDGEIKGWGLGSSREQNEEQNTLLNNQDEMSQHSDENTDMKRDIVGIFDVIVHPQYNRGFIAVVMVMLGQQLCGINSIVMYGVSLLSDLLASNSALLNLSVSLLGTITTTLFAPLVDSLGRRTCLLTSTFGMGLSSFFLALSIGHGLPILSAVSVFSFVTSFAFGLGPVPFILSSELVGPEAVGATQSWALATNWVATFVVAQFFPTVNEALGNGRVYYLFAGIAGLFWLFVAWWVPETKGKTDIDEVWAKQNRQD